MVGFRPEDVGVGGVGQGARNGHFDATADADESFAGAFRREEFAVARIDVAGEEIGADGVGAGHEQRGDAENVGGEASGDEFLNRVVCGREDVAAEASYFLKRGNLVFEVDAGGAGFDHRLHQLEGVQVAAEASFGVGDERSEPVSGAVAFGVMDLVGAHESLVDRAHQARDAVPGIEALIGIHLAGVVRVGCHLPAADVDGLQSCFHLLHGLISGDGAQR